MEAELKWLWVERQKTSAANPVDTKLNFNDLRTRLPQEITDDIVRLIANSEEALQDFAYIRTQGDVEKFNVKYGVNLVLTTRHSIGGLCLVFFKTF